MQYSVLYQLYEMFLSYCALYLNGTDPGTVSAIDLARSGRHLMLMYPQMYSP